MTSLANRMIKYRTLLKTSGFGAVIPKSFSPESMSLTQDYDFKALNSGLSEPIYDLLERGGKEWRAMLCLIVSDMLSQDLSKMALLAKAVDVIHNSSLIHDDIEDNSQMRRGKPCVHLQWGIDRAINAGSWSYFASLNSFYKAGYGEEITQKLIRCSIEDLVLLHMGQATDIEWNRSDYIPSEDQYIRMVTNKTSVLARLAVKYPAIVAGISSERLTSLENFANDLGVNFQIIDDVLNLTSEEYAKGRSYVGEDITEGKKSLIVIRAIQQQQPGKAGRLLEILRMKTSDKILVDEALEIVKGTDAVDYCLGLGRRRIEKSRNEVDRLFEDSEGKENLFGLVEGLLKLNR